MISLRADARDWSPGSGAHILEAFAKTADRGMALPGLSLQYFFFAISRKPAHSYTS